MQCILAKLQNVVIMATLRDFGLGAAGACEPQDKAHLFDEKSLHVSKVPQRFEERTHLTGAFRVIRLYV